jgi:hypothetical protein
MAPLAPRLKAPLLTASPAMQVKPVSSNPPAPLGLPPLSLINPAAP